MVKAEKMLISFLSRLIFSSNEVLNIIHVDVKITGFPRLYICIYILAVKDPTLNSFSCSFLVRIAIDIDSN